MHFDYEISPDEYVSAQKLYYRLTRGNKTLKRAIGLTVAGALFIAVAWGTADFYLARILLTVTGAWWAYLGIAMIFPAQYFRRAYPGAALVGKRFRAEVNADGFEVVGEDYSFRARWSAVSAKGENDSVFIFFSRGTIFMFGKKYLSDEQQCEFRKQAGLPE